MPLKVDKVISSVVETTEFIQKKKERPNDISALYPDSTADAGCKMCAVIDTPNGVKNVSRISSQLNLLETTEDGYAVPLGVVKCASQPVITKVCGTFESVPTIIGDVSSPYVKGALVEDASSPGSTYSLDGTFVTLVDIGGGEYMPFAYFYTANPGENFLAKVTLDVELTSDTGIEFSNI